MTDLADIDMEGVKPMADSQELPVGKYLVRIEDNEKKEVNKDVFAEDGTRLKKNEYLQLALRVYGGDHDREVEFARLNLWNHNTVAVNMAKQELKSIQEATKVVSTNSDDFRGKWMVLEKKAGTKDPQKIFKNYSAAPAELVAEFASEAPPLPAKSRSASAAAPTGNAAPAASAAASPSAKPSWAAKK